MLRLVCVLNILLCVAFAEIVCFHSFTFIIHQQSELEAVVNLIKINIVLLNTCRSPASLSNGMEIKYVTDRQRDHDAKWKRNKYQTRVDSMFFCVCVCSNFPLSWRKHRKVIARCCTHSQAWDEICITRRYTIWMPNYITNTPDR